MGAQGNHHRVAQIPLVMSGKIKKCVQTGIAGTAQYGVLCRPDEMYARPEQKPSNTYYTKSMISLQSNS